MTYDELLNLLVSSSREDWLHDDDHGIFTLRTDLDVTIREVRTERERRRFEEQWAKEFADPVAYHESYELWFRSSFVKAYTFVSVDGRASLPLPKAPDDLTITREQYAIANIVNFSGFRSYFETHIQRFNIEG
jgi:hypothetical protein